MAYYKVKPTFDRNRDDSDSNTPGPIRDITSAKGPMSKTKGHHDAVSVGKASDKTGKGEKNTKVNEIDFGQNLIDYKNEGFNEVVEEIGWARDKIKSRIVDRSTIDAQSNKSRSRR